MKILLLPFVSLCLVACAVDPSVVHTSNGPHILPGFELATDSGLRQTSITTNGVTVTTTTVNRNQTKAAMAYLSWLKTTALAEAVPGMVNSAGNAANKFVK